MFDARASIVNAGTRGNSIRRAWIIFNLLLIVNLSKLSCLTAQ